MENKIEVSVIVPVYNSGKTLIKTLDSLKRQNLKKDQFEVILVDDASTDSDTQSFLKKIKQQGYGDLDISVVFHEKNKWSAEARKTGVRLARAEYICCLDSDDFVSENYLKSSILILNAYPGAGWTYPNIQEFEYTNNYTEAEDFEAKKLFFRNFCAVASVFRKSMWEKLGGQRTAFVINTMRFFEDWDFWIRGAAAGFYGVPNREGTFYYRRTLKSNITRSRRLLFLTNYRVQRMNLWNYFLLFRANKKFKKEIQKQDRDSFLDRCFRGIYSRLSQKLIGQKIDKMPFHLLLMSLLCPQRFIKTLAHKKSALPDEAGIVIGIRKKIDFEKIKIPKFKKDKQQKKIFFTHFWWHKGGAENVLLDWVSACRERSDVKIFDIVLSSYEEKGDEEHRFDEVVDEVIALDRLSSHSFMRVKIAMELIAREQPDVIFNMSNPIFYLLSPWIKKHFPQIKMVDFLHAEGNGDPVWFGVADAYKKHLDQRIVISEFWKRVLLEKYGESESRIHVAENGIDLAKFDPQLFDPKALKKEFKLKESDIVVGFLGRLDANKCPQMFIELAHALSDDTRYKFLIVGDGVLRPEILKKIQTLPNLRYLGATTKPEQVLALFDIAVFPSRFEGYPMVGIEAAAMNTPIIATDIVGFREQVSDGRFGELFRIKKPKTEARYVSNLLRNGLEDLLRKGANGRAFVKAKHDLKKQRPKYKKILDSLFQ